MGCQLERRTAEGQRQPLKEGPRMPVRVRPSAQPGADPGRVNSPSSRYAILGFIFQNGISVVAAAWRDFEQQVPLRAAHRRRACNYVLGSEEADGTQTECTRCSPSVSPRSCPSFVRSERPSGAWHPHERGRRLRGVRERPPSKEAKDDVVRAARDSDAAERDRHVVRPW